MLPVATPYSVNRGGDKEGEGNAPKICLIEVYLLKYYFWKPPYI